MARRRGRGLGGRRCDEFGELGFEAGQTGCKRVPLVLSMEEKDGVSRGNGVQQSEMR